MDSQFEAAIITEAKRFTIIMYIGIKWRTYNGDFYQD